MKLSKRVSCVFLAASADVVRAFCGSGGSRSRSRSSNECAPVAFVGRSSSATKPKAPGGTRLFGLLEEIEGGSYDLLGNNKKNEGGGDAANNRGLTDAYEVMLAELVFSTNDPRVDIVDRYELVTDPAFLEWLLNDKIEQSTDPEERLALKDLYELILDIRTKVQVNELAQRRQAEEAARAERERVASAEEQAAKGRQMSTADILKQATAIDTKGISTELEAKRREEEASGRSKKQTFYEAEITPEIRLSYEQLLKKVLPPYRAGETCQTVVYSYYDQFDAQFVKVLGERVDQGCTDSKALLEALAVEQQKKIETATKVLKDVLSLGDPMRMQGAIVKLAREGKCDEAFLLLLEANEQQASAANAKGPAELMRKLRLRAIDEKDKQSQSKEIRLLRQLLRTDDINKREKLFEDAFTPKEALIVPGTMENAQRAADGEAPEQKQPLPEVPPPDFINACKAVLLNFGNLGNDDEERGTLEQRIKKLAAEAEVVATRIYGKGMTLREQQDRMWAEQTTSIFDLERMEIEAERNGEHAPWTNPNASEDMFLPGFDSKGRMQIGGQ